MDTKVNNPERLRATPQDAWQATLSELELQMTKATFQSWLAHAAFVSENDGVFTIGVRNEFAKDWIESRLDETIRRTLDAIWGQPTRLVITVDGSADDSSLANGLSHNTAVPQSVPPPPEEPDQRPARPTDGYGGNLNPDERQALLDKIKAREQENGSQPQLARAHQTGKRGPKYRVPRQPNRRKNGRGDQANIDVVERDPMKAHVETPHYAKRFWQPILGVNAFALWELLRSYYFFVKYYNAEQPTITLLCETLGWKDRRTLLGREATETKAAQTGAVQVLEQHGILKHQSTGDGPQTVHHFRHVLDDLPLLTPKQVAQLSKAKQVEHEVFLSFYDFDIDAWLSIPDGTNVRESDAKRVL